MAAAIDPDPWLAALDDFEDRLAGYRAVLDADEAPPPGTWPPAPLQDRQLPAELAARARELLRAAEELHEQLRLRRDGLGRPPPAGPRHRPFPGRATLQADL